jgi:retron-type reverse transcriptase
MKRYGNLYASVCNFKNLLIAARKAEKGKRFRSSCRSFNLDLEKNLLSLQKELKDKIYRPGHYHHFKIHEPKERIISAAPYRDRVIHHALVNVIEPIFDARMIFDSYANRINKGTHKAVDRFTQFARKRNYVLKMDIVRYFPSLDHEILMAAIARKIKDNDILRLVKVILESGKRPTNSDCLWYFPGDDLFTPWNRTRGLPIGNLTSQFFANVYLDSLDHHIKEKLKCKFYIRYMDDFVIFDNSKNLLKERRQKVIEYLKMLRLKVHLNKAQIWPVAKGTDWLGYRIYPTHRLVRRSNIRKFRRRLQHLAKAYAGGEIQLEQVNSSMMSWIGHVQHADSYGLRKKIFGEVSFQRG